MLRLVDDDTAALRFMESLHDFMIAHWAHEPLRLTEARSGAKVCDPQQPWFIGSVPVYDGHGGSHFRDGSEP